MAKKIISIHIVLFHASTLPTLVLKNLGRIYIFLCFALSDQCFYVCQYLERKLDISCCYVQTTLKEQIRPATKLLTRK